MSSIQGRGTSFPSEPPRFFNRGPSPIARLTFFGVISLALMFVDARFKTLETVRMAIATVVYPVQQAALMPAQLARGANEFFDTRTELRDENTRLKADLLQATQAQQAQVASQQESDRLSKLLQISQTSPVRAQAARVVYLGRDPFSQKAFVDRGMSQPFEPGSAVVDELGLLGQLTRVHPLFAETTLITEKDFAVPVKIERTGMHALLYGRGANKLPELSSVSSNADVKDGDVLLTSSIDGVYPSNIRVARIVSVKRNAENPFALIECVPTANVASAAAVLILDKPAAPAPRPAVETATADAHSKKRR
jgi:rod shape-determining protein MreC